MILMEQFTLSVYFQIMKTIFTRVFSFTFQENVFVLYLLPFTSF